ncbi:sulfite exporter TauE/SafE family protein [Chloroflexi bacterium TSY]|nr:sulfite exporter TauE/SafE family protein [Chloroflexi bacterium TSY]
MIQVLFIGLTIGIVLGLVSIGGLLLAPILSYFLEIDLHYAMATSLWSFLFTGAAGTIAYARRGAISWSIAGWLSLGIIPATILGARTNIALSTQTLTILLSLLIIVSAVNTLRRRSTTSDVMRTLHPPVLIAVGAVVGFGSALIGAGGAVFLLPILLFLNVPALIAIGICQVVQLPVALFSSLGFVLYGEVNFVMGTGLGILQALGVVIGARIAHHLPTDRLRQVAAVALICVAILMFGRAL